MSNTKPNFTDCCREVAEKNCKDLPYTVYESPSTLMQQAAQLYADRRVEEAMRKLNEPDDDDGWIYCPNCGRVKSDD